MSNCCGLNFYKKRVSWARNAAAQIQKRVMSFKAYVIGGNVAKRPRRGRRNRRGCGVPLPLKWRVAAEMAAISWQAPCEATKKRHGVKPSSSSARACCLLLPQKSSQIRRLYMACFPETTDGQQLIASSKSVSRDEIKAMIRYNEIWESSAQKIFEICRA